MMVPACVYVCVHFGLQVNVCTALQTHIKQHCQVLAYLLGCVCV